MFFKKSSKQTLNYRQKLAGVLPKKSVYALTFGQIRSRKKLKRLVTTRYVLEN